MPEAEYKVTVGIKEIKLKAADEGAAASLALPQIKDNVRR